MMVVSLTDYIRYKRTEQDRAPHTISNYEHCVRRLGIDTVDENSLDELWTHLTSLLPRTQEDKGNGQSQYGTVYQFRQLVEGARRNGSAGRRRPACPP